MKRLFKGLIAALVSLALVGQASAAGSLVTRTVQDGSGAHTEYYLDESGVGTGPFEPTRVIVDANGNVWGSVTNSPLYTVIQNGTGQISNSNPLQTSAPETGEVAWLGPISGGVSVTGPVVNGAAASLTVDMQTLGYSVLEYRTTSLGTSTATITVQESDDAFATTSNTVNCYRQDGALIGANSAASATNTFACPITSRYAQLNVTATSGGATPPSGFLSLKRTMTLPLLPAITVANGVATPASAPVVAAFGMAFNGTTFDPIADDTLKNLKVSIGTPGGYPATSTPIVGVGTGTTAAVTGTLAAAASKFTYICGFSITADATAFTVGSATVTGTQSTLTFQQTVGAVASAVGGVNQTFNPCLQSSAVNTPIVVTSAAAGTLGNTDVNVWGYQQ